MNEFLKVEYENCLDLIKYYDERQLLLVKFTTAVSSSIISLIFGFHAVGQAAQPYFWHFAATLTGVASLGLLALFVAMVQNRLYFVYPARQVNAIRRSMLAKVSADFSDNQMYVTSNVPALKFLSLHTLMILLVALQVGTFVAFCWFAVTLDPTSVGATLPYALIVAALVAVLLFTLAATYLHRRGKYHPDRAVHLIKNAPQ